MADRNTSTPSPGEITILAAGAVALIFSFFKFYKFPSVEVPVRGGSQTAGGGGISAWGSGLFPVATIMVILVVVMAVLIGLTRFASVRLPARVLGFTWEQIHLVLGFFAALYAVAWLLTSKGGADFGIGFWFILLACLAALVGAILIWRERVGTHPDSPTI